MYHDALGYCGYRPSRLDLKQKIAEVERRFRDGQLLDNQGRQRLREYHRALRVRLAVLYLTDQDRE